MEYKVYMGGIAVRLEKGDDIADSLLRVAEAEHVTLAEVSGIGAVDLLTVGVFDLDKGQYARFDYRGNHEIDALCGNLSTMDGKPYVHLHVTATDGTGRTVGGHLLSSRISLTAEIFIRPLGGVGVRRHDADLGINLLHLE